ncbi:amino acid permease [Ligilactobacillus ruminis]|jgi:AAT family amino acid transporter|uniref:amino acid permease n=1 Tax=Ligilactobacillus ruminis TaxID=1623 RepID=UPI00232C4854|nr:amino acid permease [Ligilactobacillus ruminis]MDB7638272.1 amino acid permease [Ligilactobacillus ruminis]MDB7681352.1 amino acid permease [Ligilactobacillus ruminis]
MAEINKDGTRRELTNLNVQMIALGGSIGTGLFLGSGSTIHRTGPSILFVYLIVGIFFFFMLRAIGEMMYSDPEQHTFVSFIYHHLGPSLGKFAEWSYWLELTLAAMAELIAIATYVKLWLPSVPSWLIQVVVLAALTLINLNVVKFFGNSETILSGIKVVAIIFLIIVGIYMIATHHENPSGTHASSGNIFDGFSMFPNGFHEFINAFPMVFFAFQGMEFVGITTAETKNPREVLPKAINQVIVRILLFYIGALFVIMAITPWKTISEQGSPFVQIFSLAGIPAAASIINFVVIVAACSTLNSAIFSTGRHLYQLARESHSQKMKFLTKVSDRGIPVNSVLFSASVMLFAPILSCFKALSDAFSFVASVSCDIYILVCILTMIAHYRYRRSDAFLEEGFKLPAYKCTNPATIVFFIFIFLSLFLNRSSFGPALGAVLWFVCFRLIQKIRNQPEDEIEISE